MKLILFVLICALSICARSEDLIAFDRSFLVSQEKTVSLKLSEKKLIKNIIVQAEGVRSDSIIEVMVNGDVKGTIYAPGADPSYIVTILEEAASIEFRHRRGAAMRILDVKVYTTEASWEHDDFISHKPTVVRALAKKVINLSDVLADYSTIENEVRYIFPMKKSAGKLLVMSRSHGDLSLPTRKALYSMVLNIENAQVYIDELLMTPALYDYAIDVLIIKETIKEILN